MGSQQYSKVVRHGVFPGCILKARKALRNGPADSDQGDPPRCLSSCNYSYESMSYAECRGLAQGPCRCRGREKLPQRKKTPSALQQPILLSRPLDYSQSHTHELTQPGREPGDAKLPLRGHSGCIQGLPIDPGGGRKVAARVELGPARAEGEAVSSAALGPREAVPRR